MTNNIIDFSKKKLEKERKEYELNLDTEIITTRREIEELATAIKENPAKAANIVSGNRFEGSTSISNSGSTFALSNNDSTDADAYRLRYGRLSF